MQFFKHYHNADSSKEIQIIIKKYGLKGYAHWFLLLELMCEKFDGESSIVELTTSEVASKLRIKSSRVHSVITQFESLLHNQSNKDDFIIIIDCPLLLDLQDRDYKYARKVRVDSDAKKKNKDKDKRIKNKKKEIRGIHEKLDHEMLKPHFEKIKISTQDTWLKVYTDPEWVKDQLIKSLLWLQNTDQKRTDMGKFFGNWLGRATSPNVKYHRPKRSTADIAQEQIDNNPFRSGASA